MNAIPKISVVLPVYNGEKYLREAVESILNQSFEDFELILVDDGSTDSTPTIIKNFNDSRIRTIRLNTNGGIVTALNKGLSAARGKYIARMDADDVSLPERLKKQYKFMENHPEIDVCGSWVRYFTRIPGAERVYKLPGDSEIIRASLLLENLIQHPAVMCLRKIFGKTGYPGGYPHAEDYALWTQILDRVSFAVYPEVLLNYRLHKDQIWQRESKAQAKSVESVHRELLKKIGLQPTKAELMLHEDICRGNYNTSKKFVQQAENWFTKILKANRRSKVLDPKSLEAVLRDREYSIVLASNPLRPRIWQFFRRTTLVKRLLLG